MKEHEGKIKIYPWSMSITGMWGPDTGLYALRDEQAEQIAEMIWPAGIGVQQSAVVELLAHGNIRKAAQLVRALAGQHPELSEKIRSQYQGMEKLFDAPLEDFPETFKDMDAASIDIIQ